MAITQISSPHDFSPAFNEISYVFSSDNTSECDFSYVGDLYINGVLAVRITSFSEGDNDYGYIRLEEYIQDYLSFDFHDGLIGFAQDKESIVSYYLEVRERYNSSSTCTGSPTLSSVLFTTATRYAWNGCLEYEDRPGFASNDFLAVDGESRFLTNSPTRIIIPYDGQYNLSFLQEPTDPVEDAVIETYDRYGTLIGTYVIDNTFNLSSPDVPEDYKLTVGVGPDQLNDSTLSSGSQPVYHSNVHYYKVYLRNSAGEQVTESKEFQIDSRCYKFNRHRLWFWNRLGGFDAYTFPLKRKRTANIERTTIEKILPVSYTLGDRGQAVISVRATDALVYASDFMTEAEGLWIEELFTSPEVYVQVDAVYEDVFYDITGAAYDVTNTTNLVIDTGGITLASGTEFSYEVTGGEVIGMANSGTGIITGYLGSDQYTTDIPSSINQGALITGTLTINQLAAAAYRIPLIITSTSFEEKDKAIRYDIEARPAIKKTIQRQ